MNVLTPVETAATKVIAKAEHVADRQKIVAAATGNEKRRHVGRLDAGVIDLVISVDEYRNAKRKAESPP